MKRLLCFFILIVFFAGCRKNTRNDDYLQTCLLSTPPGMGDWYLIEIKSTSNMDCGVPEISFLTGVDAIKQASGSNINVYVATGLPKVNYPVGTQLSAKIKMPGAEEAIVCTAMGPSYRQVVISEVK